MSIRDDLQRLLGSATPTDAQANNAEVLALQRLLGSSLSEADPADIDVAIRLLARSLGSSVDA